MVGCRAVPPGRRWERKPPWGDGDRGALGAPRPYSRGRGRGRGGGVDPSEGSRAIGGGGRSPKPPFFSPRRGDDGSYFPVNKDRDGKKRRLGRRTLAWPRPWPCAGPAGPAARSPSRLRPPLHAAPLVGSSRPALQTPARSSPAAASAPTCPRFPSLACGGETEPLSGRSTKTAPEADVRMDLFPLLPPPGKCSCRVPTGGGGRASSPAPEGPVLCRCA